MALVTPSRPVTDETRTTADAFGYVTAALRIALGWIFLWAFLDKLFGLGHETASQAAWVNGGSPTAGFLGHATLPPENNPFLDDHIIYALTLITLALADAGRTLGLAGPWERLRLVQQYRVLR